MADEFVQTDAEGAVVLPGHPHSRYLMRENEDGSLLLMPAVVVSAAQAAANGDPELRDLLNRIDRAPTPDPKPRRRAWRDAPGRKP